MTSYRLQRGPALMMTGVLVVVAAGAVFLAFVLLQFDGVARMIGWGVAAIAVALVLRAAWLGVRPPVVLKLDAHGVRYRSRVGGRRLRWLDVTNVEAGAQLLRIETGEGEPLTVPLELFDEPRRAPLLRELYDRLNAAHGYERFNPS